MKIYITFLILSFIFFACETDQDRLGKAEKECANQTKIDGFAISFFGYFPEDADSINIKIKRNDCFILCRNSDNGFSNCGEYAIKKQEEFEQQKIGQNKIK